MTLQHLSVSYLVQNKMHIDFTYQLHGRLGSAPLLCTIFNPLVVHIRSIRICGISLYYAGKSKCGRMS